jgi:anaerobic C4-dicarboxylate transporter
MNMRTSSTCAQRELSSLVRRLRWCLALSVAFVASILVMANVPTIREAVPFSVFAGLIFANFIALIVGIYTLVRIPTKEKEVLTQRASPFEELIAPNKPR